MSEPRTPREFADAGVSILVQCRCGHEGSIDPMMVEFTHGEHFDLVADWRELTATVRCSACGSPRPVITYERNAIAAPVVTLALRRAVGGAR